MFFLSKMNLWRQPKFRGWQLARVIPTDEDLRLLALHLGMSDYQVDRYLQAELFFRYSSHKTLVYWFLQ